MNDLRYISSVPHPVGSVRQVDVTNFIFESARKFTEHAWIDTFDVNLNENKGFLNQKSIRLKARNVAAKLPLFGSKCVTLIGSHSDSFDHITPGANDSGSSSAALLMLMRYFVNFPPHTGCSLMFVWFDGEEMNENVNYSASFELNQKNGLIGSQKFAGDLRKCGKSMCLSGKFGSETVKNLILLDMIGMPTLKFLNVDDSDYSLSKIAWSIDKEHFLSKIFSNSPSAGILDDHTPFVHLGIPSIVLIGFEDKSTWHRESDNLTNISLNSIIEAIKFTTRFVEKLQRID